MARGWRPLNGSELLGWGLFFFCGEKCPLNAVSLALLPQKSERGGREEKGKG